MNGPTARVAMIVGGKIVTALIWGELLGSVISRPIAAWRQPKYSPDFEKLGTLIDVQNKRICELEEKVLGESK